MAIRRSANSAQRVDINPERDQTVPLWAHPEVRFFWRDWRLIRDCIEGERDVKDGAEWYLPQLEGQDSQEYTAYLDRATFYNFTGRTLAALVGTLFRRKWKLSDFPDELEMRLDGISKQGASFDTLARTTAEEYLALGRIGLLVDMPPMPSVTPQPYIVPYIAENIIDWEHGTDPVTGQQILTKVILREFVRAKLSTVTGSTYHKAYRVLSLDYEPVVDVLGNPIGTRAVYRQRTYTKPDADAVPEGEPTTTVTPRVRGEPLNYIPFHVFQAPRPPLLDIARLNISHYKSYAHLEHGRFFTGLPVYYAEVTQNSSPGNYYVGPANVWELAQGAKAGIIEFNGHGLGSLEKALAVKEAQAASLGGRMIGVTAQSTAETDNQTALKDRNEQALLHHTANVLDFGFTKVLRSFADFANATAPEASIAFNKSFLSESIGSREFRAIQSMYMDGILPITIVHDYLVKAGVISDEIDEDMLKEWLQDADQFPNQPDFQARQEGFPNAQARVSDKNKNRELDIAETEVDNDQENAEADREAADKRAKEAAKAAAKAPPAAPGAPPQTEPGIAQQRRGVRPPPRR